MKKIHVFLKMIILVAIALMITTGELKSKIAEQCCCDLNDPDCQETAEWMCCRWGGTGEVYSSWHYGYCFSEDICYATITIICDQVIGPPVEYDILCDCFSAICYCPH